MLRAVVLVLTVCLCGCSSQEADLAGQRQDTQASYDAAIEALEKHDYGLAETRLTEAIEGGGLRIDQLVDAYIQRAVCYARLGKFEAAHADLDQIEGGAPDLDVVYAARSFVFQKEGRTSEAAAKLNQARRLNPRVQTFED